MNSTLPPSLPPAVRQRLSAEMNGGERLLWAAQPRVTGYLRSFGIWLFAIPWTVFSLGWEAMALSPWFTGSNEEDSAGWAISIIFPLFGLPFVLIGFGMLASPFFALTKARRTILAVTDQRILRIITGRQTQVNSVPVDRIGPVQRIEGRNGYGSLLIETHSRIDGDGDRQTQRFEMMGIPQPRKVEQIILSRQPQGRNMSVSRG